MIICKKGRRHACYCRWISAILLIVSGFSVNAGSIELKINTTEISLEARDADLREILELLAERADFDLWMSLYVTTKPVNFSIRSESMETVLRKLLAKESHVLVLDSKAQTPSRVKGIFVLPAGTTDAKELAPITDNRQAGLQDQAQALEARLNAQKFVDKINALKLLPVEDNGTEQDEAVVADVHQDLPKLIEQIEKLRERSASHPLKQNENSSNLQDTFPAKIQTLIEAMKAGRN